MRLAHLVAGRVRRVDRAVIGALSPWGSLIGVPYGRYRLSSSNTQRRFLAERRLRLDGHHCQEEDVWTSSMHGAAASTFTRKRPWRASSTPTPTDGHASRSGHSAR